MSITEYLYSKGYTQFEGNSNDVKQQQIDLIELTNKPNITVMEIGFNAGHSAEVFLKNNDSLKLISFDIGEHDYVLVSKEYIENTYPDRHILILGNSTITVPNFIKTNPDFKFDVIFIDGGHDYEVAMKDMENCLQLAHNDTIIIMDDTIYTCNWSYDFNYGPTLAWIQFLRMNKITELKRVDYLIGRGMSWGKMK